MTAEELIQASLLQEQASQQQYCTYDPVTREITIPEKYKIIGVESDEAVNRIYFKGAKVVGNNVDLSTLTVGINYENAVHDIDRYICTDVQTDGDNITFSWVPSRKVTKARGDVNFIICATKISSTGVITNEWNTTIGTTTCKAGIEPDEISPDDERLDVITQLINLTQQTSEEAVSAIGTAKTSALSDISSASSTATSSIGTAKSGALSAVEEAKEDALSAIAEVKEEALEEIELPMVTNHTLIFGTFGTSGKLVIES